MSHFTLSKIYFVISIICLISISEASENNLNCQVSHKSGGKITKSSGELICPFKLWNENISQCEIVKYTSNSQDCQDLEFKQGSSRELSEFKLKSYYYNGLHYKHSAFNATFSKIGWSHLILRYKLRGPEAKSYCQEFNLHDAKFSAEAEFYWECPVFSDKYENREFDLEYTAHGDFQEETRKYVLKIPLRHKIDPAETLLKDWQVFIYVDLTKPSKLTVHFQAAPKCFGVKSYKLNMISMTTGHVVENYTVHVIHPDEESAAECKANEELYSQVFSKSPSGELYFTVQPEHKDCPLEQCMSKSARVRLAVQSLMLYIVGACVAVGVAVLLCGAYIWIMSYFGLPDTPPVVLVVYKRTRQSHVEAVLAFADYLKRACHIDARIDEVNIPLSNSKNPFIWSQETFNCADVVMVVPSPPPISNHEAGIYRDVAGIGLRLLAENFLNNHKRFLCAVLPYCKGKDIPVEARNLQRFTLNKDLDKMLWYIHHGSKSPWISKLYFLLKRQVPGRKSKLECQGQNLLAALLKAEHDVSRVGPVIPVNQSGIEIGDLPAVPSLQPHLDLHKTTEVAQPEVDFPFPGDIQILLNEVQQLIPPIESANTHDSESHINVQNLIL